MAKCTCGCRMQHIKKLWLRDVILKINIAILNLTGWKLSREKGGWGLISLNILILNHDSVSCIR